MATQPVIKWTGSKRSQSAEIIKHFPVSFNTYYEPFIGGGSMMRRLIDERMFRDFDRIECSDLNGDLINLWNMIKESPDKVAEHYKALWTEMNSTNDIESKKQYFNRIRERYNRERNPLDFMFIMRTCTNGMPRYNRNSEFNNTFHCTRDGINPETLEEIIYDWSNELNYNNVMFYHRSYDEIKPGKDDFCYFDPPYAATKQIYFSNFDTDRFFEFLRGLDCKWVLSYDGISGDVDNTYAVPEDLYDEHLYIKSGNSSFKRTIGKNSDAIVYESLYIKY